MTTEYSISVNDWNHEEWEFTGMDVMRSFYEANPKEAEKDGHELDEGGNVKYLDEIIEDFFPMMLYAYPLDSEPPTMKIIKLCRNTNCTVVMKRDTEDYFLALTGGGMDLSQDIAMAYIIAEDFVPASLAMEVSTQEGLSKHGKEWMKVMRYCAKSLDIHAHFCKSRVKTIKQAVKDYKKRHAEKVSEGTDIASTDKPKKKQDSFDRALEISEEDLRYDI
jgi:hypothetical protein